MSTNDSVYAGLKPAAVWRHFAALNKIPRPSKHEQKAREYVLRVAQENGAFYECDDYGNVVVYVPASSPALADAPVISFQSHLDMVCQNVPEVEFDPLTDSIVTYRDGDKIRARGTTLGADNGIGASLMLALITSNKITHGPLELLFTVEEEIGLNGASNLDASLISSRTMINLDGTEVTEVTVGCAGGEGVDVAYELQPQESAADLQYYQIQVGGLSGGHSGAQIHEPHANAIKLLAQILQSIVENGANLRLCNIEGGSAHNAIPRDATATIAIPATTETLEALIAAQKESIENQWKKDEPDLSIKVLLSDAAKSTFDVESTRAAVQLLHDLPHGVQQMSTRFSGKVETSCNLSNVEIAENTLQAHISSRSLIDAELDKLQRRIVEICEEDGAQAARIEGYPGWEPREKSKLAEITAAAIENITGDAPKVEVIHAGLEGGVIASKIDNLDVISIGAELHNLHSPNEYVVIPSVEIAWKVICAVLQEYAHA